MLFVVARGLSDDVTAGDNSPMIIHAPTKHTKAAAHQKLFVQYKITILMKSVLVNNITVSYSE